MTSLDLVRIDPRNDDLAASICLSLVPGIGPRHHHDLLSAFGSAVGVLNAPPSALCEVDGIGTKLAKLIARAAETVDLQSELEICREQSIRIVARGSADYPRLLHEIYDPPGVLYVRGTLQPTDGVAVAIVGTRHATSYGLRQARQLASHLAQRGVTIVSGLARGIDGAAHESALEAGGRTLAVLAHGLSHVYPVEHQELSRRVAEQGALVAESPPRSSVPRGGFPRRNRIISGLALGVIVVEAGERSGALITARMAMEQGREVFAVPGRIDTRTSRGCHALLRDGATLIESADDVLSQLGPLVDATPGRDGAILRHAKELQLNEQESAVLQAASTEPTPIDQIVVTTGIPVARVLATISVLEMKRLLRRISGHTVARR